MACPMADIDLSDLQSFAAIARARSYRAAAALRGVSASSLSEAMRRLEARLGLRLLNRTTRSVTPTEAGARLLERLAPALGEITSALDEVHDAHAGPSGTLRLNVPGAVSRLVLPDIIGPFLRSCPGITLEVTSQDSFIDVLAAGFDAGIRYDERLHRDMIAVPIGPRVQRFAVAGSPAYLSEHGQPTHPNDLMAHACIRHRFESGVTSPWEFERDGQVVKVDPRGPFVGTSIELELAAATAGLGLIATFEGFLAPSVARGELEWVLGDWAQSFSGPFLYYPSRRHMPAPLRAFVDFIKSRPVSDAGSAPHLPRLPAAPASRRPRDRRG